ncbi:MAG: helix-turn-helix transcriptional regulator [Candidatus Binatia bacterium]
MNGQYERRLALAVFGLLGVILVFGTADIVDDYHKGTPFVHLAVEGGLISAAGLGIAVMASRLHFFGRHAQEMERRLEATAKEAEHWRREARTQVRDLSVAIGHQFDRWDLSSAEREVALLLLQGKGYKEIALQRRVKDRTIRTQAQALYGKAGVGGRAELSAFFLQDLLSPGSLAADGDDGRDRDGGGRSPAGRNS